MKVLCLLIIFATSSAYAQKVRENVKVKTRTPVSKVKYVPEKFVSSDAPAAKAPPSSSNSKSKNKK